jgi:hypothetical protein
MSSVSLNFRTKRKYHYGEGVTTTRIGTAAKIKPEHGVI